MTDQREKLLVAFGNYLLSKERRQSIGHENSLNAVTDADLRNFEFLEKQGQLEKDNTQKLK